MATEYESGYCNNCKADRKVERKATNHILHLLITVILGFFTMGIGSIIWICVWILSSIKFGGWICSTCGSNKVEVKKNYFKISIYILIAILIVVTMNNINNKKNVTNKKSINEIKENIKSDILYNENIFDAYWEDSILYISIKENDIDGKIAAEDICKNQLQNETSLFNNGDLFIEVKDVNTNNSITGVICKTSK